METLKYDTILSHWLHCLNRSDDTKSDENKPNPTSAPKKENLQIFPQIDIELNSIVATFSSIIPKSTLDTDKSKLVTDKGSVSDRQ